MLSVSFYGVLGVACASIGLGLITLLNNGKSRTNQFFATLCGLAGVYSVINYLADHDQARSLVWVRLTFALSAFLILLMFLFINNLSRKVFSLTPTLIFGALTTIVAIITLLPNFVPRVELSPDRANVVEGSLYPIFIAYVVIGIVLTFWLIRHQLIHSTSVEKERVRYVATGLILTAVLTSITNLFLPLIQGNNDLAALGSYFILVFIGICTYAIIRHRLFNIRILVARSVAYVLLLTTLAVACGAILLVISRIFLPSTSETVQQGIITTALALSVALIFQPLRLFFERITNTVFFRNGYDTEVVLNNFTKLLVSELDLNRILKRSLTELSESLHIQFAQIIVFNNDRVYRVEHYGELPRRLMVAPELAKLDKPMLVADELPGGERKTLMDKHGVRLSMTLRTRDEFIGYLLLGDKLSGEIYSTQDAELLEIIAGELAVAISNAKAYAQIQEFNLTLQARVDHATNRLRVANRHLKELDHAKDEFISMASHQLRTPLTTIKGYLSMMLEGDAGKLSKGQSEFTQYAFDSSERMVNLISDLLNVSRLSAGRFLIQTKPTDMIAMVNDEVRQLQSHASAKGIKLIFDAPPGGLPPAEVDDNKTRQVVMNFIDNAIYYTQQGEVRVTLEKAGENIRLEVRDTGIGVPEKARKKLFSKFFRADNAQTVRPDGTGLGLYLAKRVIQDQGGTIIFSSVEGKGSTFGFELPFKPVKPIHEVPHHGRHNPHKA
ncbi:MAG TPA: ATP-binding protein [Candidatus Saccharimonadia bacterium]|nr:ATP-binding protein [Candidatus Saccharimonadia bacterium]